MREWVVLWTVWVVLAGVRLSIGTGAGSISIASFRDLRGVLSGVY